MDGNFQISLVMPMGTQKGSMELHAEDGRLTGALSILNVRHEISGDITDDGFSFSGEIQHMIGRIRFALNGNVDGDEMRAVARTNYGNYNLTGRKTSA